MKSNAAIWAGSGAPPQITAGDTAAMAAPVAGFDSSLQPGHTEGTSLESTNTTSLKVAHEAATATAAGASPPAATPPAAFIQKK